MVIPAEDTVLVITGAGIDVSPRLARFLQNDDKGMLKEAGDPRSVGVVELETSFVDDEYSIFPLSRGP